MKICIVSPTYPYQGSAECVFVEALVNEFVKLGHECTVIAPFSLLTFLQGKIKKSVYYEKRIIGKEGYVNIYKPKVFTYRDLSLCGVSYSSYVAGRSIEKTIEKHHLTFDLIYCHFFVQGFRAYKYAKKYQIPMVIATGESTIQKLNKPFKSFRYEEFREHVKGIVCVSTKNKEECIKLGYANADKCRVIPNAVNLSLFTRQSNREQIRNTLGLMPNDVAIISVGEFCDRKGQNRVVDAVKELRKKSICNIKIIFIGRSLSKNYQIKSDKSIIYQSAVNHDDLPDYLYAADLFVLPTLREGCCNAIIEGMACGLPIISSDLSFNYDILNKKNSIMINPLNVKEISAAIEKLATDVTIRKKMGSAAFEKAQELSIEKRAINIMHFITEQLSKES